MFSSMHCKALHCIALWAITCLTSKHSLLACSPRGKFYYAMYDFTPETGEVTLLRVVRGQAVRVVQVTFFVLTFAVSSSHLLLFGRE